MKKTQPSSSTGSIRRKARLAEALRDNLARRKVRVRAAKSGGDHENEAASGTTGEIATAVSDTDVGNN